MPLFHYNFDLHLHKYNKTKILLNSKLMNLTILVINVNRFFSYIERMKIVKIGRRLEKKLQVFSENEAKISPTREKCAQEFY